MVAARLPWAALARPLSAAQRRSLVRALRGLLDWNATLARWPSVRGAPDATPFVSLYARGQVRGCYGHAEGAPGERLARAFVRAATDARYGGVPAAERAALVAAVSYPTAWRAVRGEHALEVFEPGTHGAVLVRDGRALAVLLPQVAVDNGLDAPRFLATLARKAGLAADGYLDAELVLFEAESVGSRDAAVGVARARDGDAAAAAWLARQVARSGEVCFAVDARTGVRTARGPMFHGRASTLAQALVAHGGRTRDAGLRSRRFLERELRAGLAGRDVDAWPTGAGELAGTLALAVLAGVDVRAELLALAQESRGAVASGWHAGQVALALGDATPPRVWRAAVADAARRPFAPWTLLAAHARDDSADVVARLEASLSAALREHGPHEGGAGVTSVPELALTAVAVEALAPLAARSRRARAAVARGRAFLSRWQLLPGRIPAALDPELAAGAFPASPVQPALRCDVTAHALLALRA